MSKFDRIFVQDFLLNAQIGIHPHERGKSQRIKISAVADIAPLGRKSEDRIEDIVSYDAIIRAIKSRVEEGHINLVETLAERIANDLLLNCPRIMRVAIKVEKLDVLPGSVGVEIIRAR